MVSLCFFGVFGLCFCCVSASSAFLLLFCLLLLFCFCCFLCFCFSPLCFCCFSALAAVLLSLFVFAFPSVCFLTFGSGVLLGGALPPAQPHATKSALHLRHPRLPRNQYFKVNSPGHKLLTNHICLLCWFSFSLLFLC